MIQRDQMKPSSITPRSGWPLLFAATLLLLSSCLSGVRGTQLAAEYFNLGNGYYELGDNPRAIGYYRKAVELDPVNSRARFNLSLALIKDGQAEEARLQLEQLRELDPENLELAEALAFVRQVEGATAEAEALYRYVLERSPGNAAARYNLAVLLEQTERPGEALRELQTLLGADPDDLEARFREGVLLLALGRKESAAESFLAYLQERPDSVEAYLRLAEAYRLEERYDKALDAYETALSFEEKLPEAWFFSALIRLTQIDDPDRGLTALRQALETGFRDRGLTKLLLDSQHLLEREKVQELLAAHGLLSGSAAAAGEGPPPGAAAGEGGLRKPAAPAAGGGGS